MGAFDSVLDAADDIVRMLRKLETPDAAAVAISIAMGKFYAMYDHDLELGEKMARIAFDEVRNSDGSV
jgi:hypothetical protein